MSDIQQIIEKFCNRTGSRFIGFEDGLYKFEGINGFLYLLKSSKLRNMVKKF